MADERLGPPAPMVLAVILCDSIYQDPATKKCTLLGTFSTITVRQFPATHRQLAIHVALSNGHGTTRIRLVLTGPGEEAKPLFSKEGTIEFRDPRMVAELNFGITNLQFEEPGEHRIQVFGNDELLMERRLYVFDVKNMPRPPETPPA